MKELRAISLFQPWASFCVTSLTPHARPSKMHETRSWRTSYRGELLIHATAKEPPEVHARFLDDPVLRSLLTIELGSFVRLPRGAIVGCVELVDVGPVELVRDRLFFHDRVLGDYSDGRYAWELARPRKLAEPIPCRGGRALWIPSVEVQTRARIALADLEMRS